jgi:hypothetical protein
VENLTSTFLSIFLGKVFDMDMDFLQKHFCGVFELPLPRIAPKRTKTKTKNKQGAGKKKPVTPVVGGWVRV